MITVGKIIANQYCPSAYVPTIRRLLEEVGGSISWCPGNKNPADPLSRQPIERPRTSPPTGLIGVINGTPIDRLRFRHFTALKSGRDEFTRLRLPQLRERVDPLEVQKVEAELPDPTAVASCLRWRLRGLVIEAAIRKVKTDLEVAENAKAARRN